MNLVGLENKLRFEEIDNMFVKYYFYVEIPEDMYFLIEIFSIVQTNVKRGLQNSHPFNMSIDNFYEYLKYRFSNPLEFNEYLINAITKFFIEKYDNDYEKETVRTLILLSKFRLNDETIILSIEFKQKIHKLLNKLDLRLENLEIIEEIIEDEY